MAGNFHIGQRVRIVNTVQRTTWGAPCNWGGSEGTILGGGGRVGGVRIYLVGTDESLHWGTPGADLAEGVLQAIQAAPGQPDLFGGEAA